MIGAPAMSTDNYYRAYAIWNMLLEYSLDNRTVNLSFQSTSMHVFHASVSIKCCVGNVRHDIVFILVYFESY